MKNTKSRKGKWASPKSQSGFGDEELRQRLISLGAGANRRSYLDAMGYKSEPTPEQEEFFPSWAKKPGKSTKKEHPMEKLIRPIGDQAMENVLTEARKQKKPISPTDSGQQLKNLKAVGRDD
jgi:hypothetical protein